MAAVRMLRSAFFRPNLSISDKPKNGGTMPMKTSGWLSRHRFAVGTATSAAAVALIAVGVPAAALATHPASHARPAQVGPGYPPPGGIYTQFTNCPLLNPIMQETPPGPGYPGTSLAYCVDGAAASGSITIGNITTPVVRPVNVQFGVWTPPNATNGGDNPGGSAAFAGGILPPIAGIGALLSTKPDLIPGSLTTVLGCATTTDPVVKDLCTKAENFGGKYLDVYALAKNVGQLTNFGLTTWTQRVDFQLQNPLLGNNCYIGSANNPVVVNPQLSLSPTGSVAIYQDPNPLKHPNTEVLNLYGAIASDTTFTAPGVTGCGPGGIANVSVDEALDAGTGLPAASGVNSLTLNGEFSVAASFPVEDTSLTLPQNNAKNLLSAFKDSIGVPPVHGPRGAVRRISGPISAAGLHRQLLRHLGVRSR
jgi:hypothetical protein